MALAQKVEASSDVCVLLIDDEADFVDDCAAILRRLGYCCLTAASGAIGLEVFRQARPPVVLTDLKMAETDGLTLLRAIKALAPDTIVILITAYATIETAIAATRAGAFDYLRKPFTTEELRTILQRAFEYRDRMTRPERAASDRTATMDFSTIIGASEPVKEMVRTAACAAQGDANVLLLGETGTGKEMLAKAIHANSARARGPFIPVDCAALPEPLLESELFGHERGAFTGAVSQQRGLLELANGGTLFLDEVGELSLFTQVKLLRSLEERQIRRVGGHDFVGLDIRIMAATHQKLEEMMAARRFRDDLYYRLNVLAIRLPPLRERPGDIPLLARHYLDACARRANARVLGISAAALLVLEQYPWPGNVRELRNVIERAVSISSEQYLSPLDFPEELLRESRNIGAGFRHEKRRNVESFERQSVAELLTRTKGNVTEAAKVAGMDRAAFHRLMRKYGIDSRGYRSQPAPERG
ncbi:MAG: sigma-54-dependent Fis family transcriptional regulator [Candidatus Solibacter usitatus]|nr:sigma-54-dependent Fis family transcriptional regulator [Candidatus Solibacter usitatus]